MMTLLCKVLLILSFVTPTLNWYTIFHFYQIEEDSTPCFQESFRNQEKNHGTHESKNVGRGTERSRAKKPPNCNLQVRILSFYASVS